MKTLLTAINSKYIHSNLAVYSLEAYHNNRHPNSLSTVQIAEYTINQHTDDIIMDIYKQKPDMIAFSCYIWNIEYIKIIASQLKKVLPDSPIWLGGPEVTYEARKFLIENEWADGIMLGEGEETFSELIEAIGNNIPLEDINGIIFRNNAEILQTPARELMNMDDLPFIYDDMKPFINKIIYYESSRGCPFGCSYCLSSVETTVRFRSLPLVFEDLKKFLDMEVKQVKFVDRTFNCDHKRTVELFRFIRDNDNGVTNFHFETAADLLRPNEIELLHTMRKGLVQLEIGVQSSNPETIKEINRTMDLKLLTNVVNKINDGDNVHQHLDLIAGLPYEDYKSFEKSFNFVYKLQPEQLQLGFLKVLKGSPMHEKADEYGLVYKDFPPYEVMKTKWISYDEIIKLKGIEEVVELYYNSHQFENTMKYLGKFFRSKFAMYEKLADFYNRMGYAYRKFSRIERYNMLLTFVMESCPKEDFTIIMDIMKFDVYLRENVKTRPRFALDGSFTDKAYLKELYIASGYTNNSHLELFHGESAEFLNITDEIFCDFKYSNPNNFWVLFDYNDRNPLNYAAASHRLKENIATQK